MKTRHTHKTTIHGGLHQIYKATLFGDAAELLSGSTLLPEVTICDQEEDWGKAHSSRVHHLGPRKPFMSNECVCIETIEEKEQDAYLRFEQRGFDNKLLGTLDHVEAEMRFTPVGKHDVEVEWTYTFHPKSAWGMPLAWLLAHVVYPGAMRRTMKAMKHFVEKGRYYEPFPFARTRRAVGH